MTGPIRFTYHLPTRIVFRRGAVADLPLLDEIKDRRCMLLTYHGFRDDTLISSLRASAAALDAVDAFEENPRDSFVRRLAERAVANETETVIAIGGGSTMDTGKGVAWFAANPDARREKPGANPARIAVVAVPTTAGTGSEVSPFMVLTDAETHAKWFVKHASLIPTDALCDANLTATMPKRVTGHTGVDALSHAVEAYLSRSCQGFMEDTALSCCRLVAEHLPRALDAPDDVDARERMMLAALDGGIVLANCGTVVVHAMGYALTTVYDLAHGHINGILLAGFVERLAARGSERAKRVMDIFGGDLAGFIERCGIEQALPVGSERGDLVERCTEAGYLAYGRPNCVVSLERDDIRRIIERVVR